MECKICGSESHKIFNVKILKKYDVDYFCCIKCDFVQSEKPFWLEEAYSDAITGFDIGYVNRNISASYHTVSLLKLFFNRNAHYIDYGGGYGLFVRLMRDKGFNFYRQDLHCLNIFSKNFDVVDIENTKFELLTSFEVFEHLENPIDELNIMLKYSDSILFSTKVFKGKAVDIKDWWYLAPRFGQHISLYSIESLNQLAMRFGLNYYTDGKDIHLFTKRKISKFLFKLVTSQKLSFLIWFMKFHENKSLQELDFNYLNKKFN